MLPLTAYYYVKMVTGTRSLLSTCFSFVVFLVQTPNGLSQYRRISRTRGQPIRIGTTLRGLISEELALRCNEQCNTLPLRETATPPRQGTKKVATRCYQSIDFISKFYCCFGEQEEYKEVAEFVSQRLVSIKSDREANPCVGRPAEG